MRIVCDSSPLIHLARIGKLSLLRDLYGSLVVPEAVWREVVVDGAGQPGADEVGAAAWIRREAVSNIALVRALKQELGSGEAEAIALALETQAKLLLMDDLLGRETAQHLGLRCSGLLGVVIQAKRRGLIPAIRPLLDALRGISGFHVAQALYMRVLQDEGEVGAAGGE